jgi:hypothetical protein
VSAEETGGPGREPSHNVDRDRLYLIVSPTELDIVVDALRSVGNVELAERFESVLRQFAENTRRDRQL